MENKINNFRRNEPVPGWNLLFFFCTGASLAVVGVVVGVVVVVVVVVAEATFASGVTVVVVLFSLVATLFLGTFPPVDLRAVCFVLAMKKKGGRKGVVLLML